MRQSLHVGAYVHVCICIYICIYIYMITINCVYAHMHACVTHILVCVQCVCRCGRVLPAQVAQIFSGACGPVPRQLRFGIIRAEGRSGEFRIRNRLRCFVLCCMHGTGMHGTFKCAVPVTASAVVCRRQCAAVLATALAPLSAANSGVGAPRVTRDGW